MEQHEWEPRLHEGSLLRMLGRKAREELNETKIILYQEFLEKLLENYGEKKTRFYLKKLKRILSQI